MRSMPGCEIIEHNIQVDHIHMVMVVPPRHAVSEVVGRIKGMSTILLRGNFLVNQTTLEWKCRLVIWIRCFNSGN